MAAVLYGLYALRPKPGSRLQQHPRQAEASASLTASAASSSAQQQHHAVSNTSQQVQCSLPHGQRQAADKHCIVHLT